MMTLMALSLVIGILIDDAVVVRENIYRHMEQGKDPMTAARDGTAEIGLAVMATTFTILAVFLPVGFMTGIVGQFFKSFALTIAFAVAMSLLVAFTLDPMLSSRFVRFIPPEERARTRVGRMLEGWGALLRPHRPALPPACSAGRSSIRGRWSPSPSLVFVASLSTLAVIGTEFVPAEDRGQFEVIVELPPGTSFEQSEVAVANVETIVRGMPEVRQIFSTVGVNGDALKARLRVKTTSKLERERGLQAIKAEARQRLAAVPLVKATVTDPEFMQGAPERGADQRLRARRRHGRAAAAERRDRRQDPAGARHRRRRQHARERPARDGRAASIARWPPTSASRSATVAAQLRGMVEGVVPTKLRDGDEEYDIRVRLAPEFRNDFAGHRPHAALLAARRRGAHRRHRRGWSPGSARPTSSASSGGGRPRSASSSTTGRSATSPPTSRR